VLAIVREEADETGRAGQAGRAGEKNLCLLETQSGRGVRRVRHARHVVMAIGYYDHPVMLGIPVENLSHVRHYYAEPHVHYRQRVVIVGGRQFRRRIGLEMFAPAPM